MYKLLPLIFLSVIAISCGTSTTSSPVGESYTTDSDDPVVFIQDNPELISTLNEGESIMDEIGEAAELESPVLLVSACVALSEYATDSLDEWSDAPLPYFVASLESLSDAADHCLSGDLEEMLTSVQSATDLLSLQTEALKE